MQVSEEPFDPKAAWRAEILGGEARQLLFGAIEADTEGDPERSSRLLNEAEERLALAQALAGGTPETLAYLEGIGRHIREVAKAILEDVHAHTGYKYLAGGSFAKTKAVKPHKTMRLGKIEWRFDFNGKVKCDCACFVTVFHFENAKTGALITPQSKGFAPGFDMPTGLPHDGRQVRGYSVDAGGLKYGKVGLKMVKRKCACDLGNKRKKGPDRLEGEDQPTGIRAGVVGVYETAVVCLKKRPFEVLGSMVWTVRGAEVEIGKTKAGTIDRGDASIPFKRALNDWIVHHGNDCCQ